MRFRQIHLDFHTSEKIPEIGSKFSKEQFQKALKLGNVDSITVFSKCHHGWAYHPSSANEMHPNLNFDLLKAQIDAAHEIGVKTPVYLSAGFDEKMARRHPEWLVRNKDETLHWILDFNRPGFHRFCFNSPYLDYLINQVLEVVENYEADGIFMDIVGVMPCYCQNCINTMLSLGQDPYDEKNVTALAESVYANYTKKVRQAIHHIKPSLSVFHNGGHIRHGRRDLAEMNTHLELESLPTGGWGYDHFPFSASYARTLEMEFLGMTGKFHSSWGEFGGFKHPNALKYEVALSAANGAKCSIGDQLHPSGEMDLATYKLIGEAYKTVKDSEKWLESANNIADIAMISNEAFSNYYNREKTIDESKADTGCVRILLEGKYLFDTVDLSCDFIKYKLVIMPDNILLDEMLTEKLENYLKKGGKILATGKSGLNTEKSDFVIDFGCSYKGEGDYKPSYIRPSFNIECLDNSAFVMYSECRKIEITSGEELAVIEKPYFNRSTFEFCSHLHTPTSGLKYQSAIVKTQNTIYIAYDVFADYATKGSIVCKEIVKYAVNLLLGDEKSIHADIGAQGIVTVTEQKDKWNIHLLYAVPVKRGEKVEVIEDIMPVFDVSVKIKAPKTPKKIYLAPQMEELNFNNESGYIYFNVPKVACWQIVTMEF